MLVLDFGSINQCWGLDCATYFTFSFPFPSILSRSHTQISMVFFALRPRCYFFALEKLISKRKNLYNWDIFSLSQHSPKKKKKKERKKKLTWVNIPLRKHFVEGKNPFPPYTLRHERVSISWASLIQTRTTKCFDNCWRKSTEALCI